MRSRGEFLLHLSFSLKRTFPFDSCEHCDFVFDKIGVENAEQQKSYFPSVLNFYKKFLLHPQRSFLKRLFIGTTPRKFLKMATDLKMVLKGLRDQEVERGSPK